MRNLVTVFIILLSITASAQKVVKYYDAQWTETSPEKALYYANFIKDGVAYKCTSYWKASNTLRGSSTFPDTIMLNPIGLQLLYDKKGKIEDSIFFADGKAQYLYHYYPNHKLQVHYYLPENQKVGITEAFDEDGKKLKSYILSKDAEFKGGQKAWESYIRKNISQELLVKKDDITAATVQVQFIVDENGDVTKAKIFKSSGNKNIDGDAVRVISESPAWKNAIAYNVPVKSLKIQPISYTFEPGKTKDKK